MADAAAAHPEAERVELWFMDEARVGQMSSDIGDCPLAT